MIDAKGRYLSGRVETEGGIDSKITSRRTFYGSATQIRDRLRFAEKDIGTCSRPVNISTTPRLYLPDPLSFPPPLRSTEMLVGPCPPTHPSSYLFRDAMERRGRSRAIPTTAVIRRSHHHQRQLYYSHYSTNPPSPSLSPVRSPQYVSLCSPHFP